MPRKPREEEAGAVHHVYARGNARARIYRDDADRRTYLGIVDLVVGKVGWRFLGYCLMSNHLHLVVETPRPNLGEGIQRLHGLYAQAYNRRHKRDGHLFQGRYGSVRVKTDEQLWMTVAYVVRNPVEAHLCRRPEHWPWSSHAATLGGPRPEWLDVPRLLSYFEAPARDPRSRYAELTATARAAA